MNYSKDQIKLMAREFMNTVRSKTGWRTNGVVVDRFNNKSLTLQVPGWSKGTEFDEYVKVPDPVAQKKYEDYLDIEDKFNKKYPGMKFGIAGGATGERVAKMNETMNIGKELSRIAKLIESFENHDEWVSVDQVRQICASCADKMESKGMTKIRTSALITAAQTSSKTAGAWDKLPKGWTKESLKSFWKSLTGDHKHKITACHEKLKGNINDAWAFCASLSRELDKQ